jgi:DNA-binding transcriptional LysR family regulator
MARRSNWEDQIGRRLRLRDLHVLFIVAQRGSMAKAAAELGISQPAVSDVIATLEGEIGVKLFDRKSHGVEPTIYGQALLKRSLNAFDELKQGIRDIDFLADPTSGELRIGCGTSMFPTIMPPIIHRFSQAYPRVSLSVDEIPPPAYDLSALRERHYDLPMGRWLMPKDRREEDIKVTHLFNDPLVIAAGPNHRWIRRHRIDLAELVDEPWIMTPPNDWSIEIFRARGLPAPNSKLSTMSMHIRTYMLARGQFLTAAPRSLADSYGLKILPVDLPVQQGPVVIVTLMNRTLSPVVDRFIEHVREFTRPARDRDVSPRPGTSRGSA